MILENKKAQFNIFALFTFLASLIALFAFGVKTPLAQTLTNEEKLIIDITAECERGYSIADPWIEKFNDGVSYPTLRLGVRNGGFTLQELISEISRILISKRSVMKGNCDSAQLAKEDEAGLRKILADIQSRVADLSTDVPVYTSLTGVEAIYAKAQKLANDRDMTATVENAPVFMRYLLDVASGALTVAGKIIDDNLALVDKQISEINANMPALDFYSGMLYKDAAGVTADLTQLNAKISTNNSKIKSATSTLKKAIDAVSAVLVKAAQDGVLPDLMDSRVRERYLPLYTSYSARASVMCTKLKAVIDEKVKQLEPSLGVLVTDFKNISQSTNIAVQEEVKKKIARLGEIKTALTADCKTSYNNALAQDTAYKNLLLTKVIFPLVRTMKSFNKTYDKVVRLMSFYNTFRESKKEVGEGLRGDDGNTATLDQSNLLALETGISQAYPVTLALLTGEKKANIEGKMQGTAVSNDEKAYKELKDAIKSYNTDLNAAKKQFDAFQQEWWKLVKQAAVEGIVEFKTIEGLSEELRAAELFESFQKKRTGFYTSARKIIDARKAEIQKKQVKVDETKNIPDSVKGAVAISYKTVKFLDVLENYYTTEIAPTTNYYDLRDAVRGIKNLGVNTYRWAQGEYIKFGDYFGKTGVLKILLTVGTTKIQSFDARIAALEANTDKAAAAGVLRTRYNDLVQNVNDMESRMGTLLTADLVEILGAPEAVENYLDMKAKDKALRTDLSKLIGEVKGLLSQIKALEAE